MTKKRRKPAGPTKAELQAAEERAKLQKFYDELEEAKTQQYAEVQRQAASVGNTVGWKPGTKPWLRKEFKQRPMNLKRIGRK